MTVPYDWQELRALLGSLERQPDLDSADREAIACALRILLDNLLIVTENLRPRLDPLLGSVIRERFNQEEQRLLRAFLLPDA